MSQGRRFSNAIRLGGVACLAAIAVVAAAPGTAGAEVLCSYDSGAEVLNVTMSADNDGGSLAVGAASAIQVRGGGPVLSCTGGSPTLTNTDFINVFDNSSGGSTRFSILEAANFAALGIILAMSNGTHDRIFVSGSAGADHLVLGAGGIDSDADGNTDVSFFGSTPEEIQVGTGDGADTIEAQGSASTGAPLTAAFLTLEGDNENDTLNGSDAGDLLEGGNGNDTLRGFGGNDRLVPDALVPGNDAMEGGSGADTLAFPFVQNAVTVDLGVTAAQATGQGSDTISQVENVDGTSFADTLIGDAGPNELKGEVGDDTVDGRGGSDTLSASLGTDTVTYAGAPSAVAVNLNAGMATGGYGTDSLAEFENLVGSPFGDTLTGSIAANTITPMGGADVVQALGGADLVNLRDGVADNASCGTEVDRAVSDRRSLDTIQPDCEQVDALPEAVGVGGGQAVDRTLFFRLTGARKQALLKQKAVVVKIRCPDEACAIVAKASGRLAALEGATVSAATRLKLKTVKRQLPAGPAKTLKLRLGKAQRAAIRARLDEGLKPKLKVTVTATDAAGNTESPALTVTAKR